MMPNNPNVEEILMRTCEECLRGISNAHSYGGRSAWYYTHCGEIEMAFHLGLISQERFEELNEEWHQHKPTQ